MEATLSVPELLKSVSKLDNTEFDQLLKKLHAQRAKRSVPSLTRRESAFLLIINEGFSSEKNDRLKELDNMMEMSKLSDTEAAELLDLSTELQDYTVKRLRALHELAKIRKVSLDELMEKLELSPI